MEYIREGFRHVHRNWQLVLILFAVSVINLLALLVIVVLPLAMGLVMLGVDLSELQRLDNLIETARNPAQFFSRHMGIALIAAVSLLVYSLLAFSLWIYVLGGAAGVLGLSVKDSSLRFSMGSFISEGKRLFFPLAGYTSIAGLAFILLVVAAVVLGVLTAFALKGLGILDAYSLSLFLKVFLSLSIGISGIAFLAVSIEGLTALVIERASPLKSFVRAFHHLRRTPQALRLLAIAVSGYIGLQVLLVVMGYGFRLMPLGIYLALPFRAVSSIVTSCVLLAMVAAIFAHFVSARAGDPGIAAPTAGGSSPDAGTL